MDGNEHLTEIDELIAASSLGADGVAQLSSRTSDETLAAIRRKAAAPAYSPWRHRRERAASLLRPIRQGPLGDRGLRRAILVGVGWLALYTLAMVVVAGRPTARRLLSDIIYLAPIALAAVLSLRVARNATGRRQRLWWLLAASNTLWLAGEMTWAVYFYLLHHDPPPFPSAADALYLASYALVPLAVLVGFEGASSRRRVQVLTDAIVVGGGLGALAWRLLMSPQFSTGLSWRTATSITYPLLGMVTVITVVSVALAGHRRVAMSVWLVAAAFTMSTLTDACYTYLVVVHEYLSGSWLNIGWQVEAVLLCLAAYCAATQESKDQVVERGRDLVVAPALVGAAGALLFVGVEGLHHRMSSGTLAMMIVVVIGLTVRFLLSNAETRHVAMRDRLTGLHNRQFFDEMLRLYVERTVRGDGQLALVLVDLDRFKEINDEHGYQSGDVVLVEVAARLQKVAGNSLVVARSGGEEFVVLLPDTTPAAAAQIAEQYRRALSEETILLPNGVRRTVTASCGIACLPEHALDADALIRHADQAVRRQKHRTQPSSRAPKSRHRITRRAGRSAANQPHGVRE